MSKVVTQLDWRTFEITISSGNTDADNAFNMIGMSGGMVDIPADLNAETITFKVSDTEGGTYSTLTDSSGSNVSMTGSTGWQKLPSDLAGAGYVKIVAGANVGADRTFTVLLHG